MAKSKTHPPVVTESIELEQWMVELTEGHMYFVSTARWDYVGRLHRVTGQYMIVLTEAARVAHSGRFHEFIRDGRNDQMEIEPILTPGGVISCQWLDWTPWFHLPLREVV